LSFAAQSGILESTMLGDILQYVPQIIKEAATSPQGILALMIIALAILAFYFFKDAGVPVRVAIFIMVFCGVVLFAAKVAYKANQVRSANASPTPGPADDTPEGSVGEPTSRPMSPAEALDQMISKIDALQTQGLSELYDDSAGPERLSNAHRAFDEADTLLTQAEKNAGGNVQLLELRGYMYKDFAMLSREQGRPEKEFKGYLNSAENTFKAVLERRPSPSAYNGLGNVYMLRGDFDRAKKEIHSALELEPEYGPAKQDLQQIEDLQKRKKQP
jgi:tetratricopeptide (TPR) repeat protein